MRIVITGAGGFVGKTLVRRLAGDHRIVALDHVPVGIDGVETVTGDFCEPAVLAAAFAGGCDAVVHLATVPGGAAENDPATAQRVNVAATMALVAAAAAAGKCPRFIFASSIAVFGEPLPTHVDDATALRPILLYGAHKAMVELWLATQTRRGAVAGLALRLPGIVARPPSAAGMKSAFMSDVLVALAARTPITLPVGPAATMWLMSVGRCAANFVHALAVDATGAMTLPAIRVRMDELVAAAARTVGSDPRLVSYAPDPLLEAGFGRQPPLTTAAADALGFTHDGDLDQLVRAALAQGTGS